MRRSAEPSRHVEIARKLHRLVDYLSAMIEMMDEHLRAGPITILPNGEIRALTADEREANRKPLTMRENLGGEYGIAA